MDGWRRLRAGVLLVAVLTFWLAGCSDNKGGNTADASKPRLPPGSIEVAAGTDASTGIENMVTVKIPGESIDGKGQLSVTETDAEVEPGSDLVVAGGPAVEVEMTDASLVGPATITFDTGDPPSLPDGVDPTPVMVVWDDKAEQWTEQPALYDADTGSLVAQTDHFSTWSWLWPSERFATVALDALDVVLGGGASQPTCKSEDAARSDGWSITSDKGDRIRWCFGIEGGKRVVRVANNRPYPVVLTYDGDAYTLAQGPENDVSVYSLYRALLEAQGRETSTPQVALPAGATLTLHIADGAADGTFGVRTEWDSLAMFAEILDLMWQTILLTAGGSAAPGTAEKFVDVVTQGDCIRSGILGDSGLNKAVTLSDAFNATFQLLRTCGPDLARITAEAAGKTNPVYGVVNWLTTTLISALRQLLGDAYGIVDIWTSPTANAGYRIAVKQQSASAPTYAQIANSSIPSLCGHPATRLVNGEHTEITMPYAYLRLVETLGPTQPGVLRGVPSDQGPLTAVVATCNQGGVAWPSLLMFFASGGRYVTSTFLDEFDWPSLGMSGAGRDGIMSMGIAGDGIWVSLFATLPEDAECCPSGEATLSMQVHGGRVTITDGVSEAGD